MALLKPHWTVLAVLLATTSPSLPLLPLTELAPVRAETTTPQTEADRILEQGRQQYRAGQLSAALQLFQQALKLYQQDKNGPGEVKALRNIGNVFYVTGKIAEATTFYQQSLTLAQAQKDWQGEAAALQNLGNVAESTGNYDLALNLGQQSLKIYRANNDRQGEADVIGNIGNVYLQRNNYKQALDYYEQSLVLLRQLKDRKTEGSTLGNIGLIYYSQGDYLKAIDYHKQHLAIAQETNNRLEQIAVLNNLGNDYLGLGAYAQAITYLEQSLQLAREVGDLSSVGKALSNLGIAYENLGQPARAIVYQMQSLELARQTQNRGDEARSLGNLGNLFLNSDPAKALDYHQQRLAIAQELKDPGGEATAYNNIGGAYTRLGNYPKAQASFEQSLKLNRALGNRSGEQTALLNLGMLANAQKNYSQAIGYQKQALAFATEQKDLASQGILLNNLGLSYFLSGDLANAETTLFQGLKVLETIRANVGDKDDKQVAIFETQARTYRLLQRVLVARNKPEAALEVTERGRTRAFVELLARRNQGGAPSSPVGTTQPITVAQIKQIAREHNTTLVEYAVTYEDVEVNGRVEPREAELLIWVVKPTGEIAFRQKDLRPYRNQLVDSNPNEDNLAARYSVLYRLVQGTRRSLGVGTRGFSFTENPELIAQRNTVESQRLTNENLQKLHQLLIEPISDLLPKTETERVTFIPQGFLFLAPFAALQNQSGQYLIEKHTITIAPSIQVLAFTRQQRQRLKNSGNVLVVGNPTMPKLRFKSDVPAQQLPSLPGAEKEATEIAGFLKTQALTGAQATEAEVTRRMSQARIIHLATHGFLNLQVEAILAAFQASGKSPNLAAPDAATMSQQFFLDDAPAGAIALAPAPDRVALTPPGPEDGLLTPDEIVKLNLQAELVVLSACDTLGNNIRGDGVIGLARSFMAAGAPSVIVSLWKVPDDPTAALMTEFYQQLQRQPDKAKALRVAMLKTLKDYPDPVAWAPFILMGEAE